MSLQSQLRDRAEREPQSRALTFYGPRGDFEWISFGDLYEEASRRAQVLSAEGLRAGDSCVITLPSDRSCAMSVLGCLLAGGVPLLVAPPIIRGLHSNIRQTLSHVVQRTGARLLIVEDGAENAAEWAGDLAEPPRVLPISRVMEGGDASAAPLVFPGDDAIAAMQLTSGTTGLPRICVWKQSGVAASLDGMEQAMDLTPEDVFVNWTPLYHDMGLVNNFFLCLAKGIPLVWLQATDFVKKPARWFSALHATGATTTWSPNFGFALAVSRISDAEMEGVRLDGVKGFWNAAERIHAETIHQFRDRFSRFGLGTHAVKTNFGCAENVGGATFSSTSGSPAIERLCRRSFHDEGLAVPADASLPDEATVSVVSTGPGYPGMSIRILSETGEILPEGHIGIVALNTPSRMIGYLGDPEESAAALQGEWLFTGDVGYLRNNELFWTGRVRERMNLNGKKYDPSDFERVLLDIEGLREGCFAAFGVDDARIGSQRLVIVSEVRDGATREMDDILREIRQRVAGSMGVGVTEILLLPPATMSKTTSGKRRHRFYKELHAQGGLEPVASWREAH
jgi:fatty-acyl-CoA synthase